MWVGKITADGSQMEVYDHNDDLVVTIDNDGVGFSKQDVQDAAFDSMEGDQPSAYNQSLISCMATNQIEITREEDDPS